MIVLVPKNVQIDNDVIRREFMSDYYPAMETTENAKKGEWVSLKKNVFIAVHFHVDEDANDGFTTIFTDHGGTKVGDYIGADIWGQLFYGSFFNDVETNFVYWLMKKYDLKKEEIKLKNESFFKNILWLIGAWIVEYVLSFDFDDYSIYIIMALATTALFIPYWFWERRSIKKRAKELGIEMV